MIGDLINRVSNQVIENLKEKNKEFVKMKIASGDNPNFILGRTFSLGQWFGYYLGMEVAKELLNYTILVDTCLTTIKKYESKNPNAKRKENRISFYPDILILEKTNRELMADELPFKNENKKSLKSDEIQVFKIVKLLELKIDPGYIDFDSLNDVNKYINNNERFTFDRLFQISDKKDGKTKVIKEKNIVYFDGQPIEKVLILSTEANHSERVNEIKKICTENHFKYIALTDSKEHIRHIEW